MAPMTDDRLDCRVFQRVHEADAVILPPEVYGPEFRTAYERAGGVVWKLERAQHFHEPYEASWEAAMIAGDWERSLRLIDLMRGDLVTDYAGYAEFRRVRVVDTPLTPYMQWELHVLAARVDAGERIRVVPGSSVRDLERPAPLPELLVFESGLMYEVLYDASGAHLGGRRITEPGVVEACRSAVAALYEQGEDLGPYFRREVLPLPAPRPRRARSA
ncbi:hypothetical protein Sme01_07870 [Sphaerisporangium melleum]|uniref:DUF6879 domain-containing protein n=1 Tax=Sphaerisporangium melleum TaxID=321316 RepID=A0A917QW56_9ACTN|nr:DUF6879 family protein [Sphaerisporangium melleum]GGK72670.1 hypothetical protein GCM10007964_14320 [Sphaerisporangium melleum]GII68311.1 hypothetical protein Sme01_07870 [Sphaerisporangium melleum]